MSFRDVQLPDLEGARKLTRLTAGIADFYKCEIVFTTTDLAGYASFAWMPGTYMGRHRRGDIESKGFCVTAWLRTRYHIPKSSC